MAPNQQEKIFGSINRQFLLYFLLFSYIPLMIFSIISFFAAKSSLNDIDRDCLIEVNHAERYKIEELLVNHDKITDAILKETVNLSFLELKEKIAHSNGWDGVILLDGDDTFYQRGDKINDIKEQLRKKEKYVLDWHDNKLYIKKTIDAQKTLYFPFDLSKIQNILKSVNLHCYSELVYKKDNLCVYISDTGVSTKKNRSYRYKEFVEYTNSLDKELSLTTYRSSVILNEKLFIFLKHIFLANIIIGILLFFVAFFLANKIVTPIRLLAEAAEKISRGELCDKANDESKNELKTMGDQFDAMRFKLKAAYTNLERKIEERTKALQEAQFQVSHQEKMASLGLMAAGVAHEIGNPLTSISSLTQIIKRKIDDPQQLKYADTILENIERISVIVHELVDFARPTSYRALMSNINEIIHNAVNIARYDSRAKQIDFELKLQEDLPPIQLVADQLLQVFINILINAVDALGENDNKVTVSTFSKDEKVYIVFKDNGAGIEEESITKIFQPFFTTKEVGKGTGLGLSVSYGIIKNLNGHIEVKSKLGEGSEFTVRIPIDQSCGKKER